MSGRCYTLVLRTKVGALLLLTATGALIFSQVGCAEIKLQVRSSDRPLSQAHGIKRHFASESSLACKISDQLELDCQLREIEICARTRTEMVEHSEIERRSSSSTAKIVEFGGGAGLGVAGGLVLRDLPNVPRDHELVGNAVGRSGATAIGASLAATGAILLTMGVIDAIRATDSIRLVGKKESIVVGEKFECAADAREGEPLTFALSPTRAQFAQTLTNTSGSVRVLTNAIAKAFIESPGSQADSIDVRGANREAHVKLSPEFLRTHGPARDAFRTTAAHARLKEASRCLADDDLGAATSLVDEGLQWATGTQAEATVLRSLEELRKRIETKEATDREAEERAEQKRADAEERAEEKRTQAEERAESVRAQAEARAEQAAQRQLCGAKCKMACSSWQYKNNPAMCLDGCVRLCVRN